MVQRAKRTDLHDIPVDDRRESGRDDGPGEGGCDEPGRSPRASMEEVWQRIERTTTFEEVAVAEKKEALSIWEMHDEASVSGESARGRFWGEKLPASEEAADQESTDEGACSRGERLISPAEIGVSPAR